MMRRLLIFGFLFISLGLTIAEKTYWDCFNDKIPVARCVIEVSDNQLDKIEREESGRQSSIGFSKVLEESGRLVAEGVKTFFDNDDDGSDLTDNKYQDESRKKKFGKKKKKMLMKLIPIAMLFKAKISLILQMISTHFQIKFFKIALLTLMINAARFWLDLKKGPSKVIYYEHAQHQHHYDPDDHGDYWRRSIDHGHNDENLDYADGWEPSNL